MGTMMEDSGGECTSAVCCAMISAARSLSRAVNANGIFHSRVQLHPP